MGLGWQWGGMGGEGVGLGWRGGEGMGLGWQWGGDGGGKVWGWDGSGVLLWGCPWHRCVPLPHFLPLGVPISP